MADVVQRLSVLAEEHLEPGESVVAGTRCAPRGSTKRRAVGAGAGGLIGALVASKSHETDHVLYGEELPHDLALALTDRRILIYSVSQWSGKATKVLQDVPLADVAGVEPEEGRFMGRKILHFSLRFRDGSALELESPSAVKGAHAFCQALDATLDAAGTPRGGPGGDPQ